jgi:predicted double-glycine peptidase
MDTHACRLRDSWCGWPCTLLMWLLWTSPVFALSPSDNRVDRNVCGRISLMSVLHFVSGNSHAEELGHLLPNERAPFSMAEIEAAARTLGYQTRLMSWSSKTQAAFPCPAVVHVRARGTSGSPDHFIACFGETAGGLCVGDFPLPPFSVSREDFNDYWAGHTLYIDQPRSLRMHLLGSPLWMRLLAVDVGALVLAACLIRRPASRCATENQ